jgi:hypothetical protein
VPLNAAALDDALGLVAFATDVRGGAAVATRERATLGVAGDPTWLAVAAGRGEKTEQP